MTGSYQDLGLKVWGPQTRKTKMMGSYGYGTIPAAQHQEFWVSGFGFWVSGF
jgi:hypothetical protein